MTLENNRVSLVTHDVADETGRIIDTYCTEMGMLEETGTGLPVIYPDAPEH